MTAHAATVNDLHFLRKDIIREIKSLLSRQQKVFITTWIGSRAVKDLLSISAGTLLKWRCNDTLIYTKVRQVYYYDAHKIEVILAGKKYGMLNGRGSKSQRSSLK